MLATTSQRQHQRQGDARGLACQIVSDLDQRFIGAAMRHIYTEMTRFDACIEKIDEKPLGTAIDIVFIAFKYGTLNASRGE